MKSDHANVRLVVEEDRISRLPNELIHKILSCFDIKVAVQTCVLSSRWKLLWTSMPFLNFSNVKIPDLCSFAKFMTHVLCGLNHQIHVSSVKLDFKGAANEDFVRNITSYAFSHNVQELAVNNWTIGLHVYPPCLFSSQSLKYFNLSFYGKRACVTLKTPWDFPALTTLHLSGVALCGDLFSKCVNLKNLTLKRFRIKGVDVFDINAPRLSNLRLINNSCSKILKHHNLRILQ
ncbi:F-box/FBD/LRR-repeat protein At3g51530-like [Lactuca sativa]|uniref:F-box domain-containing protein n=1 Tax=Lactuca sativa TaxID=4236 RepID=A0A9R1VZ10_LACSA|nr:F-box/FBD/LRR-repeat protein At3g51530-like [Lactuca sativa]KAJ0215240.1 hypothetical protein LSAT_V11C300106520 [Lactuca sativa]